MPTLLIKDFNLKIELLAMDTYIISEFYDYDKRVIIATLNDYLQALDAMHSELGDDQRNVIRDMLEQLNALS